MIEYVQLLWRLDHEEAVEISAIPDGGLRQQLADLFSHLQLHRTKQARIGPHDVESFHALV